jgi:hypothetical protein
VVDKALLGQVFFQYFGFPLPIILPIAPHSSSSIIIRGWYNKVSSGLGNSGLVSIPQFLEQHANIGIYFADHLVA